MRIVLRLGGSIIASPVNSDLISRYADILKGLKAHGHEVVVVVGGGKLAREFIATAKSLELNEKAQDEVAISISRVFAQLLLLKLGEIGCRTVPLTTLEALKCLKAKKVVVMGGIEPGMTTDTVAALIAERAKADLLVKATDQNGVYNKDPRKHADAVKLDHLRYEDLAKVLAENKHTAGIHQVIDPEAIKILRRKRVKVIVVNGFKPENVMAAVDGKSAGTVID